MDSTEPLPSDQARLCRLLCHAAEFPSLKGSFLVGILSLTLGGNSRWRTLVTGPFAVYAHLVFATKLSALGTLFAFWLSPTNRLNDPFDVLTSSKAILYAQVDGWTARTQRNALSAREH